MKNRFTQFDTYVTGTARFAVALGTAVALGCAIAIIKVAPTGIENTKAIEVVQLDPVVVTISKERYDAIRAETQRPSFFAKLFAKKQTAV